MKGKLNMKHAILVCAHGDMSILKWTMRILDCDNIDFFLHIDAKTTISPDEFEGVCKKSKVYLTRRIKVYWATYTQVQCELILLKAALNGTYDYFHLISGADLPIKTADEFLRFFGEADTEYIVKWKTCPRNWNRINYAYPFLKYYKRSPNKIINIIRKGIYTRVLRIPISRKREMGQKALVAGDNWFSITRKLAEYVVAQEDWIKLVFEHGYTVDELFVQTITYNSSEFQSRTSNFGTRLIDWRRGKPYVWRIEDLPEIMRSDAIFCRKFDMKVDSQIVNSIVDWLLKDKE